jgi:hypothetical protein
MHILTVKEQTDRKEWRRGQGGQGFGIHQVPLPPATFQARSVQHTISPASFQKEDKMKGNLIFKLGALSIILSFLLVVPVLGQTDEELGKQLKEYKAQTFKDLKVNPDQEKALVAIEEKFSTARGQLVDSSKKAWDDLQAALAEATPNEAKVKEGVKAYIDGQTKLFNSFRGELDEEMAQMSPVQQGKYLGAMERWRQKCMPKVCIPITK